VLHSIVCTVVAGFRRPDIVHVHGIGPALMTPLLRLLGLRVIVTHHGEDYMREKWGKAARAVLRAGEVAGMRFAHKRIAVSRTIESLVQAKYGKSCEVIPNGVAFSDLPQQTDKILELGLVPGQYVLTVGRLVPEKRQMDVLHAFRMAKLNGWKLAIVGQVDHKNRYADHLAHEAGSTTDVVMAGYQSGETLRQLYAHAGLFILPSSHEGLPIVLLEALSYGLQVLVSDIPCNMEVISNPAHIFRVGDINDLCSKMTALADVQIDEIAREARRESARGYDWSDIASRTAAAYSELIGAIHNEGPSRTISAGKILRQERGN
jgi:glycosyltransferase involved in cell wall biosynthesis